MLSGSGLLARSGWLRLAGSGWLARVGWLELSGSVYLAQAGLRLFGRACSEVRLLFELVWATVDLGLSLRGFVHYGLTQEG